MIYILLLLVAALLSVVCYLLVQNGQIRKAHARNINKLESIITSLHAKQQQLNEKVLITNDYKENYHRDMKALGDEVFELQKVFVDIISNRNYN